MKTKDCHQCEHRIYIKSEDDFRLKCKKGHKPRFYAPRYPGDLNYGYKRKCEDFNGQ